MGLDLRPGVAALAACAAIFFAGGCGGSDEESPPGTDAVTTEAEATAPEAANPATPPGTEDPSSSPLGDPGAGEASPEAQAEGTGDVSELPESDREAVEAAFDAYVAAVNARDGAGVCAAFIPGGIPPSELPVRRGACARSVGASLGREPTGGAPAWRRTRVIDLTAVAVGDDEARLTATVTHRFADRKYTSVEEDVTYLRRDGGRWLVVKPTATLYRAVGYPEPPLRAFTPPG